MKSYIVLSHIGESVFSYPRPEVILSPARFTPWRGRLRWQLSLRSRLGLPDRGRYVPPTNYAAIFGLQWNTFGETQLYSYTGKTISMDRLAQLVTGVRGDAPQRFGVVDLL